MDKNSISPTLQTNKISDKTFRNRRFATIGALSALVILLGIPGLHLGYIPLSATVSFTTIPVVVVVGAVYASLPGALITSLVFGLTSLVNAAANPMGALDPFFVWPHISILPRLLFGVVAWVLYFFLSTPARLFSKKPATKNTIKLFAATITAFLSTVIHSWTVYAALFLFLGERVRETLGDTGYWAFILLRLPNTLSEAGVTAVVVAAIVGVTAGVTTRKPKLDISQDSSQKRLDNRH